MELRSSIQRWRTAGNRGAGEALLRTTPKQRRANKTVARLLAVAAELIEECGIEGFNTNLLAERCEVRVRTVYRYFSNKHAVVAALYRQMAESWHPFFEEGFLRMGQPDTDWRKQCDEMGSGFRELLRDTPGAVAIRKAIRSNSSLIEVERLDNIYLGERFAEALSARALGVSEARLACVGRTWLTSVSMLIDLALEEDPIAQERQLNEISVLERAYLGAYLDE